MQIKTTMKYYFTPTEVTKIKMTDNNKCWQEWTEIGTLMYCLQDYKTMQPPWKTVWQFLKNLKRATK